jgi:hypothetical protein
MSFPAGKHDDQVDAIALVGQLLDKMTAGPAQKPKTPPRDSWERAFQGGGDDADLWKIA